MNIKAIINNLISVGLLGTYRIYRLRKQTRRERIYLDNALSLQDKYGADLKSLINDTNIDVKDKAIIKMAAAIMESRILKYEEAFFKRNFSESNKEELKRRMKILFDTEKYMAEFFPDRLKSIIRKGKSISLKERVPEVYKQASEMPIDEHKIVIMENGNSPSPSSSYIGKVLKKRGYNVIYKGLKTRKVSEVEYYENALDFIEEMATAKAVLLSTANDILSQFDVREGTKIIQLWHGVGVFKKVGWSTVNNEKFGKSENARIEYDQYRNYTYVTIPSEEQAWIFEDAMRIPASSRKLVAVGVSRTDVFYQKDYIDNAYNKLYRAFPQIKGKKLIIYVPTFRGAVSKAKAPDQLDIGKFAEKLSDDYALIIKHHGLSKDIPEIPEEYKNKFAFDISNTKTLSIEQLLAVGDICITDYSSVAFEFSIMERPIIFYAYDLEDYIDSRGMYYDYDEITPGPVCKTNEEMVDYIVNLSERFDKEEIINFKNKYVTMCDGNATERTIKLIEE